MKFNRILFGLCIVSIIVFSAFSITLAQEVTETEEATEMPAEVVFEQQGILPEGVEYDSEGGRFLVGSLSQGTIFEVAPDGTIAPLIEDEDLVSTVGIHIDEATNRLLVTNSNMAVFSDPSAGSAALAIYDLSSGERLAYADLMELGPENGGFFVNDVTVDDEGNAYVTNSFAPVIYKVTSEGEASIFIEDEQLSNENFGLNGIEYHSEGYLLAAVTGSGTIYKIPLDDPAAMTQVELSEPLSIDGMVLDSEGNLIVVAQTGGGQAQEVVSVSSDDDWTTATVDQRIATTNNATTVALWDDTPYYVNVYFGNPEQEQYEIVRVDFPEMAE